VARHALPPLRHRVPVRTFTRVEPTGLIAHPELDASLFFVRQPDVAGQALALLHERLREQLEEALHATGLTCQEVERELHRIGLDLRKALRMMAFLHLAQYSAAELVRIAGDLMLQSSQVFHRPLLLHASQTAYPPS
jgi:hypothetical protein